MQHVVFVLTGYLRRERRHAVGVTNEEPAAAECLKGQDAVRLVEVDWRPAQGCFKKPIAVGLRSLLWCPGVVFWSSRCQARSGLVRGASRLQDPRYGGSPGEAVADRRLQADVGVASPELS